MVLQTKTTFPKRFWQFIFALLATTILQADTYSHYQIYKLNSGNVLFRSETALETIKATSDELKGMFNAEKKQIAFSIKVTSFKGFNSPLQKEHFNENYLESDRYPDATFNGKVIEDMDFSKEGIYDVRAKGILNIHGVPIERIIRSEITIKKGKIFMHANFSMMLNDHNITIPKVVHEKLTSEIKIEVKSELQLK